MLCYYVGGCISGVASFAFSYPLDTIKIQQQYRNITFTQATIKILKNRGWRGFYRGSFPSLLSTMAVNGIFVGLCGDMRDYLVDSRTQKSGWYWELASKFHGSLFLPHYRKNIFFDDTDVYKAKEFEEASFTELFISGFTAGFVLLGLNAPIELIKTKLQSHMTITEFKGPWDCFRTIYRDNGVKGLYRGIVPMTIRNVTTGTIKFGVACSVFKLCEPDLFPIDHFQKLAALGAVGLISWIVALPFDNIKTRMQADSHRKPQYRGMAQYTKEIYSTSGVRGFYRGFWNVSARVIPLNCLTFLTYDYILRHYCEPFRQQNLHRR